MSFLLLWFFASNICMSAFSSATVCWLKTVIRGAVCDCYMARWKIGYTHFLSQLWKRFRVYFIVTIASLFSFLFSSIFFLFYYIYFLPEETIMSICSKWRMPCTLAEITAQTIHADVKDRKTRRRHHLQPPWDFQFVCILPAFKFNIAVNKWLYSCYCSYRSDSWLIPLFSWNCWLCILFFVVLQGEEES